jgi:pyridoxal phosphate enzyme (YggS family)
MLRSSVPGNVRIVAVSKTHPASAIMQAYEAGQRIFGENRVQELTAKHAGLPADIEWHFIGHLQSNKVRYIAPFVRLIHSIDSLALLRELNKEALKNNRVIDCLLQFYIATEETKFGLLMAEATAILDSEAYMAMKNIRITGVMGMSSFSDNTDLVRREFRTLHDYFMALKSSHFRDSEVFHEISMGMSGDYHIAIDEGSTMIRIGTTIFGNR